MSDFNLDNDEKDYNSQDEDYVKKNKGVVSIEKQVKEGKNFNLPIKISKVVFSYSNRSFYIASSEGIFAFSLDALNSVESFNTPLILEANVSPQQSVLAYLLDKFINGIDLGKVELICKKLNLNIVVILFEYFGKKIENDSLLHLNLIWVNSLIKMRYNELKQMKQSQKTFINLIKILNKYQNNLINVVDENSYTISYILDQ
jgi:hypothetical protein